MPFLWCILPGVQFWFSGGVLHLVDLFSSKLSWIVIWRMWLYLFIVVRNLYSLACTIGSPTSPDQKSSSDNRKDYYRYDHSDSNFGTSTESGGWIRRCSVR